jgi:hypothetical protein
MPDEDEGQPKELPQEPAAQPESPEEELEPPTGWGRVVAWFERPATLLDLGGVGVLVVAALAGYAVLAVRAVPGGGTPGAARPMGAALSTQHLAWLMGLPERQVVPAGIEFAARPDAVFGPGETLLLRISLRAPARVAVLEEAVGGPATQAAGWARRRRSFPPSSGGPGSGAFPRRLLGGRTGCAGIAPADPTARFPRRLPGGGPARSSICPPGDSAMANSPFLNPGATPCVKGCEAEESP